MNIFKKRGGIPVDSFDTLPESKALISKADTTPQLKNIFYNRQYAQYIGGSLFFETNEDDGVIAKTIMEGVNEEENFWIAMNYVKYKSESAHDYQEALNLIIKREDMQTEVAKLLLTKG